MRLRRQYTLNLAALLWYGLFAAQVVEGQVASHEKVVTIRTNEPRALVFVDSVLVGRAGQGTFHVDLAARRVHLTAPSLGSWSITPLNARLKQADSTELMLQFPYQYLINSDPYGADVYEIASGGRMRLGATPLTVSRIEQITAPLVVEKSGYQGYELTTSDGLWSRYFLELTAEPGKSIAHGATANPKRSRWWVDAASLTIAAAAGGLAVHYKFKADRRYRVYEETGDQELRPGIKRLDVRSGVALGVMQAGVAVFVVRLAIR